MFDKRGKGTSRGTVDLHLIGAGFDSRGSVRHSFTLIGSEYSTRVVLNQSQVAIIGKPSSRSDWLGFPAAEQDDSFGILSHKSPNRMNRRGNQS